MDEIGGSTLSPASHRRQVLIISHDTISGNLAGPGVRYFNFGRVLAKHSNVKLAIPSESAGGLGPMDYQIIRYERSKWRDIEAHAANADVIVCSSHTADEFPQLGEVACAVVIDGFDPLLLEWLAMNADVDLETQRAAWQNYMRTLTTQYRIGDLYLCASEDQRLWWIGMLEAHGRLNPDIYRQDPTLRSFLATVPFGLPELPRPVASRNIIRGVWSGISSEDRIVLWGGGLWPWLDPMTAIRAMAHVAKRRTDVRLVFPGSIRPGNLPSATHDAIDLARELGLLNRSVFFGDWVPYVDWPGVLSESDIALSLGNDIPETELAYRARILDCVGAEIPMVLTGGDATSELVRRHNLGIIVPFNDDFAVAEAVLELLRQPRETFSQGFAAARQGLSWDEVTRPLVQFCQNPRRAPDRLAHPDRIGHPVFLEWRDAARANRSEFDALDARYSAANQALEHVRQSLKASQSRVAINETESARLRSELETARQALSATQAELKRALATQVDFSRSLELTQHQLAEVSQDVSALRLGQTTLAKRSTELEAELESAKALVAAYERGRFMRLMRWVKTGGA